MTPTELLAPFAGRPCAFLVDWVQRHPQSMPAVAAWSRRHSGASVPREAPVGGAGTVRSSRAVVVLAGQGELFGRQH